ncbi:homocysteine S-methyltransferase family protein [Crassaminicella profunda]|uniref:homocysteine S-methyltransferase family protein n=1 Tax=Crassaminicella profunda TaxID=1286698 RepID=UPI001CA63B03|nr:homocysteine S-methyltransferase family protein [Crassaminicella profunda]QZY56073.1 homocysteine S-methyltransferase family protein [Crassaminicella profunda]
MNIKELTSKKFVFFDGAMGTMLQAAGLGIGENPESYNLLHPNIIFDIHKKYIDAGADIITTNTFGANSYKLKDSPYSVETIISSAVSIAKKASESKLVALDMGPIGQLLEPMGTLTFHDAYEIFKEQVIIGEKSGADILLLETLSDLYEAKAAILAAKENSSLPVFCTMTFQENGRTLTGTTPETMVHVLEGLGVDALGINCSLGPKEIMPLVERILKVANVPVMIQPNAGLPKLINGETVFDLTPDNFSKEIQALSALGISIIGGCCGTNPAFIKAVKDSLKNLSPVKTNPVKNTTVCSSTKTIVIGDGVKIIGERINPTGKKKLKAALKENALDYVLSEAIKQKEAGADILDVNIGLPEINEIETMTKIIKEIQSIMDLPLQIDSANPKVIEAGVRIYNGKPIINSVNGKKESMEAIFPIAKKYGACVIGLTLDEKGIPHTAEERVQITEKILHTAKLYGIPKENILIDCLVLTASAQQKEVLETLKAIRLVKEKFGVKTVLGVSNVSFGLPQRKLLTRTFLAMSLSYGLDAPIMDPLVEENIETIDTFHVLTNHDEGSKKYTNRYRKEVKKEVPVNQVEKTLKEIIIDGIKDEAALKTKELLKTLDPITIVNNYLIPALDTVGDQFEKEIIFLPQLIRSAETVKSSFEVIKEHLRTTGNTNITKGKIILATVKGDIHDIGKNIVKVLLENYGFHILDLGKDVPIETVVKTAKEQNIKLIGLSALMTTTVKNMEETIKSIRKNNIDCKVFVGGAVLTKEYANMIGADYYCKDARESVTIAQKIFDI